MPKALTDNIAGHRSKYETLAAHLPKHEVGPTYVGSGDPIMSGFRELEVIRSYVPVEGASIVDIGCGIGRLTMHLLREDIKSYLGLDILPEIIQPAIDMAKSDRRFRSALTSDCRIPCSNGEVSIVIGFSVLTHLIDEECFDYFVEARRVLDSGGTAMFSFLDFGNLSHREMFFRHHAQHRSGHGDMLKFTTRDILTTFANQAGFASAEFAEGGHLFSVSGKPSALIDVSQNSQGFSLGQSLCVLRT